jgi:hypothetical protein
LDSGSIQTYSANDTILDLDCGKPHLFPVATSKIKYTKFHCGSVALLVVFLSNIIMKRMLFRKVSAQKTRTTPGSSVYLNTPAFPSQQQNFHG